MGAKTKVSDPFAGFLLKHKKGGAGGGQDASDDDSDQQDDGQADEVRPRC